MIRWVSPRRPTVQFKRIPQKAAATAEIPASHGIIGYEALYGQAPGFMGRMLYLGKAGRMLYLGKAAKARRRSASVHHQNAARRGIIGMKQFMGKRPIILARWLI